MFIRSVKLRKPKLWLAGAAVLIAALLFLAVRAAGSRPPAAYSMKTESDRQNFIREMGWETSDTCSSCRTVTVPEDWSEAYSNYNDLQKQQGFDLEKYKGKTVEIYTYPVLNYEGHDKDCMQLTLMVYDGTLIGGDVCCTEHDGFMQGL